MKSNTRPSLKEIFTKFGYVPGYEHRSVCMKENLQYRATELGRPTMLNLRRNNVMRSYYEDGLGKLYEVNEDFEPSDSPVSDKEFEAVCRDVETMLTSYVAPQINTHAPIISHAENNTQPEEIEARQQDEELLRREEGEAWQRYEEHLKRIWMVWDLRQTYGSDWRLVRRGLELGLNEEDAKTASKSQLDFLEQWRYGSEENYSRTQEFEAMRRHQEIREQIIARFHHEETPHYRSIKSQDEIREMYQKIKNCRDEHQFQAIDLFNLPAEFAEHLTREQFDYLSNWAKDQQASAEEFLKEYEKIAELQFEEELELYRHGLSPQNIKEISSDQARALNDWVRDEKENNRMVSPEDVNNKSKQIIDLKNDYQLIAFLHRGLSLEDAKNITHDQFYCLHKLAPDQDFSAKYQQIKHITEDHKLRALSDFDFTIEDAEKITQNQYHYLSTVKHPLSTYTSTSTPRYPSNEDILTEYKKIRHLTKDHQFSALNLGLSIEDASSSNAAQIDYLCQYAREAKTDSYVGKKGLTHYRNSEEKKAYTKELVAKKFHEIADLAHGYQFSALKTGLSLHNAREISFDQSRYLTECRTGHRDEKKADDFYAQIKGFAEDRQFSAIEIGLSPESIKTITHKQLTYLWKEKKEKHLYRMEERFQEIKPLTADHQFAALSLGLSPENALTTTVDQVKYLEEWKGQHKSNRFADIQTKYLQDVKGLESHQIDLLRYGLPSAQARLTAVDQSAIIVRYAEEMRSTKFGNIEIPVNYERRNNPQVLNLEADKYEPWEKAVLEIYNAVKLRSFERDHQITSHLSYAGINYHPTQPQELNNLQKNYMMRWQSETWRGGDEINAERIRIQNLTQSHQLDACLIGLNAESAEHITPAQTAHLLQWHRSQPWNPKIAPDVNQEFATIKTLREKHQLDFLKSGISIENLQNISPEQASCLRRWCDKHGTRALNKTYEKIRDFAPHQFNAISIGLSIENAAAITPEQSQDLVTWKESKYSPSEKSINEKYQIMTQQSRGLVGRLRGEATSAQIGSKPLSADGLKRSASQENTV